MKSMTRVTRLAGGREILSLAFEFDQGELAGVEKISDTEYCTSPRQLTKLIDEDPETGLAFLRQYLYINHLWNTRQEPGSKQAIQAMKTRSKGKTGGNKRTKRGQKRKIHSSLRKGV